MRKLLVISLIVVTLSFAVAIAGAIQAYQATVSQAGGEAQSELMKIGLSRIGSGLAIGIAAGGAGIGLGTASAAAIGVIAEKPEMFGRTMIYIIFIEAMAIYGLVIALLLWIG